MYIPKHYEEPNLAVLHALMRSHPLGTWVSQGEGTLLVNHIPFLVDSKRGQFGTLIGHVARANPIWESFSRDMPSVVVFQGAQSYITPSWYPSKHEHGKTVPTWNYAVVHAHGVPRAIEEKDWLLKHVTELTNFHESRQAVPWSVSDAPTDYIDSMLKGIVGIEMAISTILGKWKISQNKPASDQLGTIEGLHQRGDSNSDEMADLVQRNTVQKES